jgi:hypothetical protein
VFGTVAVPWMLPGDIEQTGLDTEYKQGSQEDGACLFQQHYVDQLIDVREVGRLKTHLGSDWGLSSEFAAARGHALIMHPFACPGLFTESWLRAAHRQVHVARRCCRGPPCCAGT